MVKENALKYVKFPSTLKEIGDRAFMQTKLENINIIPGIKMGNSVFELCKNAKTAVVQEGVTKLEKGMLYALEGCENVKLPSTLKEIGYRAFDRLGAKHIELPEGLEVIGEEAFECSKIESITIPSSVNTIAPRAFYLAKLKEVNFKENSQIESIGEYVFNACRQLETVKLPNSLTTLEDGVFSQCPSLRSIELPDSLTTLKDVVFAGSNLTGIKLPDSLKNIGHGTFQDCYELEKVEMPANLETLGRYTFENCDKLTSVTFHESMKLSYLPQYTFFNCSTIEYIYLPRVVKSTEACAFSNCNKHPVVEYSNKNLWRSPFDCFVIDLGAYNGYYEELDKENKVYRLTSEIELEKPDYEKALDKNKEDEKKIEDDNQSGSIIKSRAAAGRESLCACGGKTNALLSPTCEPIFKYKPAISGESGLPSIDYNNSTNAVIQPIIVDKNNIEVQDVTAAVEDVDEIKQVEESENDFDTQPVMTAEDNTEKQSVSAADINSKVLNVGDVAFSVLNSSEEASEQSVIADTAESPELDLTTSDINEILIDPYKTHVTTVPIENIVEDSKSYAKQLIIAGTVGVGAAGVAVYAYLLKIGKLKFIFK